MGKNKKIRNNKVLLVLLGILLVCIIAIGILFYKFFYAGAGGTKYGLNGIENYPLSSNLQDEIKSLYSDNSKVGTVKVNTEGRVIYVDIDFKESLKVNEAKSLAEKALEKIGENNLTYYDVHFILTYSGEEENENFPLFGAKSSNSLKVVW